MVKSPTLSDHCQFYTYCPAETSSNSSKNMQEKPSTSFMELLTTENTQCREKTQCSNNSQCSDKSQLSGKSVYSDNSHYSGNLQHTAPNWIEEEIAKLSEKTKQCGGQNFWRLVVFLKKQIPEETEENLVAAVNLVRDKHGKLSGLSRDTIVREVRSIVKKDSE